MVSVCFFPYFCSVLSQSPQGQMAVDRHIVQLKRYASLNLENSQSFKSVKRRLDNGFTRLAWAVSAYFLQVIASTSKFYAEILRLTLLLFDAKYSSLIL